MPCGVLVIPDHLSEKLSPDVQFLKKKLGKGFVLEEHHSPLDAVKATKELAAAEPDRRCHVIIVHSSFFNVAKDPFAAAIFKCIENTHMASFGVGKEKQVNGIGKKYHWFMGPDGEWDIAGACKHINDILDGKFTQAGFQGPPARAAAPHAGGMQGGMMGQSMMNGPMGGMGTMGGGMGTMGGGMGTMGGGMGTMGGGMGPMGGGMGTMGSPMGGMGTAGGVGGMNMAMAPMGMNGSMGGSMGGGMGGPIGGLGSMGGGMGGQMDGGMASSGQLQAGMGNSGQLQTSMSMRAPMGGSMGTPQPGSLQPFGGQSMGHSSVASQYGAGQQDYSKAPPAAVGMGGAGADIISQVDIMAQQGIPTNDIIKVLATEVQRLTRIVEG